MRIYPKIKWIALFFIDLILSIEEIIEYYSAGCGIAYDYLISLMSEDKLFRLYAKLYLLLHPDVNDKQ